MSHRYRDLRRLPGAGPLLLAGGPARLPIATYGIGLLALVRVAYDTFALAGVVVGAFTAASLASGGVVARLAHRPHFPRVLMLLTLADAGVMAAVLTAVHLHAPPTLLTVLGVLLGAFLPPAGVVVRSRWAAVAPDESLLARAMFLESAIDEATFVVGPSLVALIGMVADPAWALAAVATVTTVGALGLSRVRSPTTSTEATTSTTDAAPWQVYAGFIGLGAAFAGIQVGTFAFTRAAGVPSAAGVVLAWFSLVSLVGGLLLGRLGELPAFSVGLGALAVSVVVMALGSATVAGLACFAVPAAALASATVALGYAEASRLTRPDRRAAVYAWCGASLGGGLALGNALGGLLAEGHGSTPVFLVGAAAAATGAVVARCAHLARGSDSPGDFRHAVGVRPAREGAGDGPDHRGARAGVGVPVGAGPADRG